MAEGATYRKKGRSGVDLLLALHPCDGMVSKVVGNVVGRIGRARHEVVVLEENRLKLACVPGIEAVEIVETEAARPMVKWTYFACFPCGSVVILADPCRGIAVLFQNLSYCSRALRDDTGVAVIAGRKFGDDSCGSHVVVATGKQCGSRGRA